MLISKHSLQSFAVDIDFQEQEMAFDTFVKALDMRSSHSMKQVLDSEM